MSGSATFWAAKSTDVKSSQTQVAESATARITTPKTGMSLKGQLPAQFWTSAETLSETKNGVKKSNWADSDDEEEFVTSFTLSGRVKELEMVLSAKDARITDLVAAVQERATRITELESELDGQKHNVAELRSVKDALATQIAMLAIENDKLVAQIDEKVRRITLLDNQVDKHRATVSKFDMGDDSTQVSSNDAALTTEAAAPATTPAKIEVQRQPTELINQVQPVARTNANAISTMATPLVDPSAATTSPKAGGPAANLSAYPTFATPATLKHAAPPPPAPKLKMPVDLSKFSNKLAAKPIAPKKKFEATSHGTAKNGPAPKIDPTSDIRTKTREERALFANGPKVHVKMGDIALSTLPKYVLMQCSQKAFKHFTENPDRNTFTLPAGSMDEAAARMHLEWMKDMTFQGRVFSITLHSDEKFDDKNLQICRAARVLGLNNMYVGHFTKVFCDRIRSNTTSYEFLHKIAAHSYPDNDPLYDCLANNLANLRTRNTVKSPAELDVLLEKHPSLKAKIVKIEQRMYKKQEDSKASMDREFVYVEKTM